MKIVPILPVSSVSGAQLGSGNFAVWAPDLIKPRIKSYGRSQLTLGAL